MAVALKLFFSRSKIEAIAASIAAVYAPFDTRGFVGFCCAGLDALELMPRASRISQGLRQYLPQDYAKAVEIIMVSLGPPLAATERNGMEPFFYLPHVFFVRDYGLGHFALSMAAQYELTQRFTAEFSLRPYLIHHLEPCLALLKCWAQDPNEHVRRLVSEGTRPRLPWAPKFDAVIAQPRLTAPLLELLKDDPSLYVRRSVANHLNDIGKDHPDYLVNFLQGWTSDGAGSSGSSGSSGSRDWLINHALRSAVKRGNTQALQVLGFGSAGPIEVLKVQAVPPVPRLGESVRIACLLRTKHPAAVAVLVDLVMEFPGRTGLRKKVFKLTKACLQPGDTLAVQKTISLKPMSTRAYYPGRFTFALLVNGARWPLLALDIG